jgi:predicted nucleic acid-binding protein
MPVELVVDASVAAKIYVTEDGSQAAEALFVSDARTIAPDLVIVELTNVAVKRVRDGSLPRAAGARMSASALTMYDELAPCGDLLARAFELAADHGLSTYDATYVALAEARRCDLVTADLRLVSRAARAGLAIEVRAL